MNTPASASPRAASRRVKRKWTVILVGVLMFGFGLREVAAPLRLAITGTTGVAELARVVKSKSGEADVMISSAVELDRQLEARDRSWTFWCDFRVSTREGREVMVRLPVGGQLKPVVPFTEPDGSPYSLTVRYDPANPQHATFPTVLAIWFMPSVILYFGLIAIIIGVVLLRRDPPMLAEESAARASAAH